MNRKLLFHAFFCLLILHVNSNAQQTFKPTDTKTVWTYDTIAELHDLAKKHLDSLDTKIADKKAASESLLNPFKDKAKARHAELVNERAKFLAQTWTCPHKFWKTCGKCSGSGKVSYTKWWILTSEKECSDCKGKGGDIKHEHPADDADHSCEPSTIKGLLNVKD